MTDKEYKIYVSGSEGIEICPVRGAGDGAELYWNGASSFGSGT